MRYGRRIQRSFFKATDNFKVNIFKFSAGVDHFKLSKIMFGTKHNECVGFESRWKVIKVISQEKSLQTDQLSVSDKGSSAVTPVDIEIQTESIETNTGTKNSNSDLEKLGKWLQNIYPSVKRELDEAISSQAFKGYRSSSENEEAICNLMQVLNISKSFETNQTVTVSSVSWNQTGKTLAVTCTLEHKHWCYHNGNVLIYRLTRDEILPNTHKMKLPTASCVTTLKFHPKHPAILAGATYSGEVLIWNIQKDEDNIVTSLNIHEETVNQLIWINDIDVNKSILLASSSNDGFLKLWNFSFGSFKLSLKARYKIKVPLLKGENKNESEVVINKSHRNVICFDFSKHVYDLFVVGLEGGLVVQCSTLGSSPLKGHTEQEPLLDPVFKYYKSHKGEIKTVHFSPNRNDLFMTYGTDLEIRMYLIGQEEPAQIIFPKKLLIDLSFVPHEEKLIVGASAEGLLEIYNVLTGKAIQNTVKDKIAKNILTSLSINPWRTSRIVVGTTDGELQLWDMPWRSFTQNN